MLYIEVRITDNITNEAMKTYYMVLESGNVELPKKFEDNSTRMDAIKWAVSQMKPECRKAVRIDNGGYYYHSIFTPII